MFFVAKKISSDLGIKDGYRLKFNVWTKWEYKQDVMHIHLHLISDL